MKLQEGEVGLEKQTKKEKKIVRAFSIKSNVFPSDGSPQRTVCHKLLAEMGLIRATPHVVITVYLSS